MPSYLIRWLLVDKLQGEVTHCGSVKACKKSLVSGLGADNGGCEAAGRYQISSGGLRPDADFSEDENPESGIGAGVARQTPSRGAG